MKPLDFFEETIENSSYKTLKGLVILITFGLYFAIPSFVFLVEKPTQFSPFVLIPIMIVVFILGNLFLSTLIHALLYALCWLLIKILPLFRLTSLAKTFQFLQKKLALIIISFFLNVIFIAWYVYTFV